MKVEVENICQAHHCENVIRGRRADARYCSESCKQVQKRYNKENGHTALTGFSTSRRRRRVDPTGDLVADVSTAAAVNLFSNNGNMIGSVVDTCAPYAIDKVTKRPIPSLLAALGGVATAKRLFKKCVITTEIPSDDDGKKKSKPTKSTKTCSPASGLQIGATAMAFVLGANYLLDHILAPNASIGVNGDTGQTRVKPASDTANAAPDVLFYPTKAN